MTEIATWLLLIVVVPGAWLALLLWPSVRRLRSLMRKNEELRRKQEELRRDNEERSRQILEKWKAPGEPS